MCLGVPGRIIKREGDYGKVDFGKSEKKINLALTPQAKEGDLVLIHAGFSIEKIKEEEDEISKKG